MTSALPSVRRWLDVGLGFVYPEVCQICGRERATAPEGFVGPACWKHVRFVIPPFCSRCGLPSEGDITTSFECANCRGADLHFRSARAAVVANDFMLDVVHRYKYSRALWFEPFLGELLTRAAVPVLRNEPCDLLVPVPLHPTKRREREFNQAERLAAWLSRATAIPVNNRLVRRVKPTLTQTALTRPQRAENMHGAFALRSRAELHGERVVLVDDVLTTGATTSACARILRSAGAGDVSVWTVARGL
jgi:competence protein ComFC